MSIYVLRSKFKNIHCYKIGYTKYYEKRKLIKYLTDRYGTSITGGRTYLDIKYTHKFLNIKKTKNVESLIHKDLDKYRCPRSEWFNCNYKTIDKVLSNYDDRLVTKWWHLNLLKKIKKIF